MENPFEKDIRRWNHVKAEHYDEDFIVMYKCGESEGVPLYEDVGFKSINSAYTYARDASREGCESYVIDIRNGIDCVIAYLSPLRIL